MGDWHGRSNSTIEEDLLRRWLVGRGIDPKNAGRAIDLVRQIANRQGLSLHEHNKQMYAVLRYGAKVKLDAGDATEDVAPID